MKVCLFGAFQVWRGQDLIERHEWDRQKTRSLLKLLLTDPGRAFSHDEIIEALWPGADFDASERSLRVTVSLLRRVLEPELARGTASRYIVQRRPGYAFNREADCWVDTWEFERLQIQANKAREVGKLEEAASGYKTALALVQGEVLAEDPYEAWAMEAKEAWQERQLAALSALAECQALQGLYSEAIHACQQALILDAYREDMYRQLMLYHSYTGEQALALQVYRRYGKLMQEEFGTAPSPEIEQLR
ncbi:MAG: winged helix-turn-helix domain-containing protein, partial [Deinococcota bacterium]|nr:winged helix-turn-helix domain-containing protein [Deinococcota bacterium]